MPSDAPKALDRETALRIAGRSGVVIPPQDVDRLLAVANGRPLPTNDLGETEPAPTFDPAWR